MSQSLEADEKLELPPDDATTRSHGDLLDRTDAILDEEHRQHGIRERDPAAAIGADQLAVDRHSRAGRQRHGARGIERDVHIFSQDTVEVAVGLSVRLRRGLRLGAGFVVLLALRLWSDLLIFGQVVDPLPDINGSCRFHRDSFRRF